MSDHYGSSAIVREAAALASIMENAELVMALARAERERIAKLVENFPIRDNSALITRARHRAGDPEPDVIAALARLLRRWRDPDPEWFLRYPPRCGDADRQVEPPDRA